MVIFQISMIKLFIYLENKLINLYIRLKSGYSPLVGVNHGRASAIKMTVQTNS